MIVHGALCTCYDCLTAGPTRCSAKCMLRFGHAGPHMGALDFARLWAREFRRRVAKKIAGNA